MKFSIITAAAIIVLTLYLGWRDEGRIAAARDRNARLTAEARRSGIHIDPEHRGRIAKRQRENRSVDVQALADVLIAFYTKDEAARTREDRADLIEMFESLDPADFRELFAKLLVAMPADEKSRAEPLVLAISQFSTLFPQATLEFLADFPEVLETGNPGKRDAINIAMWSWGAENPVAALAWYRENKDKSPDFNHDGSPGFLLSGIARTDPRMAFQLMGEPGFNAEKNAESIVRWATPENRQAALTAMREYVAGLADPQARNEISQESLKSLSESVSQLDFETAATWLDAAKLTAAEMEIFTENQIGEYFQPADTGRWIEWIAKALHAGETKAKITRLVSQWAENDYRATAEWLSATPEGPTKTAAVQAYSAAVAKYDPETAAQWAMTLPSGELRDGALGKIYQLWPKDDPAAKEAAEAFKIEHRIK